MVSYVWLREFVGKMHGYSERAVFLDMALVFDSVFINKDGFLQRSEDLDESLVDGNVACIIHICSTLCNIIARYIPCCVVDSCIIV